MSDVTRWLEAAAAGDRQAAAEILPLVYDELRKLAAAKIASEKPDHTLDTSALVHEAYLRPVVSIGRRKQRVFIGESTFRQFAWPVLSRPMGNTYER